MSDLQLTVYNFRTIMTLLFRLRLRMQPSVWLAVVEIGYRRHIGLGHFSAFRILLTPAAIAASSA